MGQRSYAIALVFIAGRFVLGVTGWEALGVEIAQAIIWSCLALSVPLADVAIHWKKFVLLSWYLSGHVCRGKTACQKTWSAPRKKNFEHLLANPRSQE